MTTDELIEKLKQYPGMRVVCPDYESRGYYDVAEVEVKEIALDAYGGGHCGTHEELDVLARNECSIELIRICSAIVIRF